MKGVLILLDGLGDLPVAQLENKTPLEAANTPNLDFLAHRSDMGCMYPVRQGFVPESDEAIVSIFGNDLISSSRGQLEAKGADLKLTRGDLALRVNFATIDNPKNGNIIDRRAGRTLTTEEAQILAKEINTKIKLSSDFIFKPTIQHRGVLVIKGGLSDNISSNDVNVYESGKFKETRKISFCEALDEEENSQHTANIINEFLVQIFDVLDKHPVNEQRRKKGLMPANYLLIRGAGIEIPKLKIYKKWTSMVYMPLEIGFAKLCGMNVETFEYPKLKGIDLYKNLYEGLEKACEASIKMLKKTYKNYDYAYIHIKETDIPGHDNKPFEKKEMIEVIDKILFKFLIKFATLNNIKLIITGDHSTPCKLKAHSADPVPVLFFSKDTIPHENNFNEKNARNGTLGKIEGKDLFKKVGFLR
jgi:2,3-bisphosphoglycerate-independent phosphoglycerate mutase